MKKNIKAILFDADGVVIRSKYFCSHFQESRGIPDHEMKTFFKDVFAQCLVGKADLKEVIIPWLEKWGWGGDVNLFLKQWFDFENKVDQEMLELISELRKHQILCYLATNQEKYRTAYIKESMGLEKVFDGIFSSSDIGFQKPEAEFFEFILAKIGIDKNSVLFVDDSPSHIAGAQAVGIESYLYQDQDDFREFIQPLFLKK